MKVGLVTIYQVPNYGSVLQAYASQCILENYGVDCEIINYRYPNEWHYRRGTQRPPKIKRLIRNILPTKKQRVLDEFRLSNLHLTKPYDSFECLRLESWDDYGTFIAGSDQIWNSRFTHADPTFLLSFAPNGARRASIASSFAQDSILDEYVDLFKQELSRFQAISVREETGVRIIKDVLNIKNNVKIILDPTLLLTGETWLNIFRLKKKYKRKPYILLYLWNYAFNPCPYIYDVVKGFAKKWKIVDVYVLEGYDKNHPMNELNVIDCSSSTIPEFMELFANADLVVTSSFHGTAFALNFGVPLVSIVPSKPSDDRMTSLCKQLEVKNCVAPIGKELQTINPCYNVETEQDLLNAVRMDCLLWIKDEVMGL